MMNIERVVLGLVDLLYSCVDGEASWFTFFDALAGHFGATVVASTASPHAGVGVDPVEMEKYKRHYLAINPWLGPGRTYPEGKVLLTEEVLPLNVYRKTAFYNEWGKKNLVTHAIGGAIWVAPGMMLFLSINRGDSQEPFGEQHRESAQLLMPHLKRAANLQSRMSAFEERAWILEGLAFPMMYVSSGGMVRWANEAAEGLLRGGRGLRLHDGRLRAEIPSDDADLQKMLGEERAFVIRRVDGYGGWLRITRPDDDSEISLFLTRPPGRIRRSLGLLEGSSGFLVFVATQTVDVHTLTQRVRQTWGLTVAEANLAVELLGSEGLQPAAEKLQISKNTAKTQLSAVFQKAGVRRQSELVRELLALAAIGGSLEGSR
jgi:DNA-binding CsgD family transcriptional regulator